MSTYTEAEWTLNAPYAHGRRLYLMARQHGASTAVRNGFLHLLDSKSDWIENAAARSTIATDSESLAIYGSAGHAELRARIFSRRDRKCFKVIESNDTTSLVVFEGSLLLRTVETNGNEVIGSSPWMTVESGRTAGINPGLAYEIGSETGAIALELISFRPTHRQTSAPAHSIASRPMTASEWLVRMRMITELFDPTALADTLLDDKHASPWW